MGDRDRSLEEKILERIGELIFEKIKLILGGLDVNLQN